MTTKRLIAATIVCLALLAGCGKSDKKDSSSKTTTTAKSSAGSGAATSAGAQASAGDKVQIKDFAFSPKSLKIKAGTTVTWTNEDDNKHTVTSDASDPAKFDSGDLVKAKTFTFTFSKPGTYKYMCDIHNYMMATVEVS